MKGDHESGIGVGGRGLARENQSRVDQIIEKKNVNKGGTTKVEYLVPYQKPFFAS